jgi:putative DNA primase/helicase
MVEPLEQIPCGAQDRPDRSGLQGDLSTQAQAPLEQNDRLALLFQRAEGKPPSPLACFPFTDSGNGEAFAYLHGQSVRYDHRRKRWLLWSGHRWQLDQAGEVERLAKQTARERLAAAAEIDDVDTRKRAASWAIQSENDSRRRAMLRAAQSENPIADSVENWDADDWLVGCENGVVDLRSGELREGKPDDRMTMTTGQRYDPKAEAPRWLGFLKEVFDDPDTIDFVQRAAGYTLSGDTSEQVIFVCHGGGANGKSKFLSALRSAFGDYAANIPFATLESSDRPGGTNDVAAIVNRRLVTASETSKSARLNEARVKALTGQDAITARFLYAEFFTFEPKAKIWLGVNHKPRVSDDSFGFWRRIRLIPFTRTFGPDQADLRLGDVLKAEADGILAWAVQGCLKWQAEGLRPPKSVHDATEAYRVESDPLANFFEERCVIEPNAQATASDLYKAYLACCEEYGEKRPMTANGFGRRLTERGFAKEREGPQKRLTYCGLGLRDSTR